MSSQRLKNSIFVPKGWHLLLMNFNLKKGFSITDFNFQRTTGKEHLVIQT